jgi:hypothetical protein
MRMRLLSRASVDGIVSILYAVRGAPTGACARSWTARGRTAAVAMAEKKESVKKDFILEGRVERMSWMVG